VIEITNSENNMESDKLEQMKYKELQKLAKKVGVKGNLPKSDLIQALLLGNENEVVESGENDLDVDENNLDATFEINECEQNVLNETFEKEAEVLNETFEKEADVLNETFEKVTETDVLKQTVAKDTEERKIDGGCTLETIDQDSSLETLDQSNNSRFIEFMVNDDDEVNFKPLLSRTSSLENDLVPNSPSPVVRNVSARKSIGGTRPPMDYLSTKNKTPLRKTAKTSGSIQKKSDSQIPRLANLGLKKKLGKVPDFAKMHEKNFNKMDSLDTYVEKKKKLTDTITKQLDKGGKSMTSKAGFKFVPEVTSTIKMNLDFGVGATTNQDAQKPALKSGSQPFKFTAKPVAASAKFVPKQRKDLKTSTMPNVSSKFQPATKKNIRKSGSTPIPSKALLNITNANKSINLTNKSISTPTKKFDLAASLAKPLTYKPHTGKLKPWERKKKEVFDRLGGATREETKQRQMDVIKGVRLNKRAEMLMMRRKISD